MNPGNRLMSGAGGFSRSRAHTPVPARSSLGSESLPHLLKMSTFLDSNYLAEGFEFSPLSTRGFHAAYLQVRQTLKIDNVFARAKASHPTVSLTVADVAAWAGISPRTYGNNHTFVLNARATLQYLRASAMERSASMESSDVRAKKQALESFLGIFFSVGELGEDWRSVGSAIELEAGGATVSQVKVKIGIFPLALIASYRHQPLTTC